MLSLIKTICYFTFLQASRIYLIVNNIRTITEVTFRICTDALPKLMFAFSREKNQRSAGTIGKITAAQFATVVHFIIVAGCVDS